MPYEGSYRTENFTRLARLASPASPRLLRSAVVRGTAGYRLTQGRFVRIVFEKKKKARREKREEGRGRKQVG
jgi:hypothetical protein